MSIREVSPKELESLSEFFYTLNGKLFVKKPYGRGDKLKSVGQEVGWSNMYGYRQLYFQGKVYMLHRVIYYLHYGNYPKLEIDHINGDGMDNRPENLRELSRQQNCRSFANPRSGGVYTSKYRGVSLHRPTNTWRSRFAVGTRETSLGYYTSELEAALAWNYKAMEEGYNPESFNKVFEE